MTLKNLLYEIAKYASKNKIINYSAAGPSLYQLNMETIKDYPLLFASPTGSHNVSPNLTTYTITLYYIDRLTTGGENDVDILSNSVEGLKTIINGIKRIPGIVEIYDDYSITNFADTQRMSDKVAGAYATIVIRTTNETTCTGEASVDGDYIPDIDDIKLQNKGLYIDENGTYTITADAGYTGLKTVNLNVNVPVGDGSYEEGFEDGKTLQKELMETITITENGTYTREDGYNEVIVNIDAGDSGYQDGYNQGVADQKAKLSNITINTNGTYTRENGWNKIYVNVENDSFLGNFLPLMEDQMADVFEAYTFWDADMETYRMEQPDNISSRGMMYLLNDGNNPIVNKLGINNLMVGTPSLWITNNLIKPWVYQERTGQRNIKILPEYWDGGFNCKNVEYIDAVFEGAEGMKMFTDLRLLGQSFTGVQTLDLSSTDFLVKKGVYTYIDCYLEIAKSVYDFTTPNANGVSYSNVKLPAKATEEARNLWLSKGWRIVE